MEPVEILPVEEVIAPDHLAELRSAPEILPLLLDTFKRESEKSFAGMESAIESDDAQLLSSLAHGMVGAAGSLGGKSLSSKCREIEQLGMSGSTDGASAMLLDAHTLYHQLCNALISITNEPH